MAEDFSNQGMLDIYLYENGQLLERLQEIVLEYKDEECFDEDSIKIGRASCRERVLQ